MYLKKYLIVLVALIFSTSVMFAQSSGNASSNVQISLKKGLTITNVTGALQFDEAVVTSSAQVISPTNVVNFLISGHSGATVNIGFPSTLSLISGLNSLTFTPSFTQTGESDSPTGGISVLASETLGLNGELNLWLSGSIAVPADAPAGIYGGSLTVTVAY
ncbi:MAG: DUF4402 domain-containing protein [Ignavibacteriae bacterium]|nr:DUF4402 domain-containing protein [Ignavibacteriota bacterium]